MPVQTRSMRRKRARASRYNFRQLPTCVLVVIADFVGEVAGDSDLLFWLIELPIPVIQSYSVTPTIKKSQLDTKLLNWLLELKRLLRHKRLHDQHLKFSIIMMAIRAADVEVAQDALYNALTVDDELLVKALHMDIDFIHYQRAIQFAPMFHLCTTLEIFIADGGAFAAEAVGSISEHTLFDVLAKASKLVRLKVKCERKAPEVYSGIDKLGKLKHLQYLELDIGLDSNQTEEVIKLLNEKGSLLYLSISFGKVESLGIFAKHVESTKSLRWFEFSLWIDVEDPEDEMADEVELIEVGKMWKALGQNNSISALSVRDTPCDIDMVASMIKTNKKMEFLHLGAHDWDIYAATEVALALSQNKSLTGLFVRRDEPKTTCVEKVRGAMKMYGIESRARLGYFESPRLVLICSWPYFVYVARSC